MAGYIELLTQTHAAPTAKQHLAVDADGYLVLGALWSEAVPGWLREIPVVETLRQVWVQNFMPVEGSARWRDTDNLPPASRYLNSPYEPEARYSKKRGLTWLGYSNSRSEQLSRDHGI